MKQEYNYEEELSIDPLALDIEWLDQASLFMRYAEAQADARLEMDQAKENMEQVRAKVDSAVRRGFYASSESGKKERLTETQVSNLVTQHTEYRSAVSDYLTSKHNYEILAAAVKAFEQRRAALENLVKLQGLNYFAGPVEPRDLGHEYTRRDYTGKSVQSRIHERLNRNRS